MNIVHELFSRVADACSVPLTFGALGPQHMKRWRRFGWNLEVKWLCSHGSSNKPPCFFGYDSIDPWFCDD